MTLHLTSPSTIFIIVLFFCFCSFFFVFPVQAAVFNSSCSSSTLIRLPFDNNDGDICSGSVPTSCPVKCFRTDPVCGADGVTYWCGSADALCAGVKVAKSGFCAVGNGGSSPLPGQALLLVHIVWLIVLGFSVLFGLF